MENKVMFLESCLAQELHNHAHEHVRFVFEPKKVHIAHGGYRYVFEWHNGIGASVICNDVSYYEFELAVMYNGELNYTTDITNDIIPGLTVQGVNDILIDINNRYGQFSKEALASFMEDKEPFYTDIRTEG